MAFVLAPDLPFEDWLAEFDAQARRAPGFFTGRPVILDLSRLTLSKPDVAGLLAQLQARSVRIIGVEGVDPDWLGPSLAPLPRSGGTTNIVAFPKDGETDASPEAPPSEAPAESNLLIDWPVRSGQCISFPQGDITIVGSVASGAELIAGGSIHVYGTLRGRAIAGAGGNRRARIFCRTLEAELLAIAGLYRTVEEIDEQHLGRPMQAWLDGNVLMLATQE